MAKKTDVLGYSIHTPDMSNTHFEDAARSLKVRPFYTGADSRPFSCLRATQFFDPVSKRSYNDFYLDGASG